MRKNVPLKHVGYHGQSGMPISEEYRVFIYAGKILAIDDYWIKNNGVSITDAEYGWTDIWTSAVKCRYILLQISRKESIIKEIHEFYRIDWPENYSCEKEL